MSHAKAKLVLVYFVRLLDYWYRAICYDAMRFIK